MIFQYKWGTPFYAQSVDLRNRILRKPLGLVFSEKDLLNEINAMHFGLFDSCNSILACLYLTPKKGYLHLKQMAVDEKFQRKGLGKVLINEIESTMLWMGNEWIYLHARKTALGFYENCGYEIDGNEFEEVGIPHYKMKKKLHFY